MGVGALSKRRSVGAKGISDRGGWEAGVKGRRDGNNSRPRGQQEPGSQRGQVAGGLRG